MFQPQINVIANKYIFFFFGSSSSLKGKLLLIPCVNEYDEQLHYETSSNMPTNQSTHQNWKPLLLLSNRLNRFRANVIFYWVNKRYVFFFSVPSAWKSRKCGNLSSFTVLCIDIEAVALMNRIKNNEHAHLLPLRFAHFLHTHLRSLILMQPYRSLSQTSICHCARFS